MSIASFFSNLERNASDLAKFGGKEALDAARRHEGVLSYISTNVKDMTNAIKKGTLSAQELGDVRTAFKAYSDAAKGLSANQKTTEFLHLLGDNFSRANKENRRLMEDLLTAESPAALIKKTKLDATDAVVVPPSKKSNTVSTTADNPTVNIDARQKTVQQAPRDMGNVEQVYPAPSTDLRQPTAKPQRQDPTFDESPAPLNGGKKEPPRDPPSSNGGSSTLPDDMDPKILAAIQDEATRQRLDILDKLHVKPGSVIQMNTSEVFEGLRTLLQNPALKILKDTPIQRETTLTPKLIYEKIRAGDSISRAELNDLESFYRSNFDAKLSESAVSARAQSLQQTAPSPLAHAASRGMVGQIVTGVADAGIRALSNINASSSSSAGRITRNVMHEWENGVTPGFLGSWRNNFADGVGFTRSRTVAIGLATTTALGSLPFWGQARFSDYETPVPYGKMLASAIWSDGDPKVDDWTELTQYMYSTKPEAAKKALGLFGITIEELEAVKIEKTKSDESNGVTTSNRDKLIEVINKLEKSPKGGSIIAESKEGLVRYISATILGKPVSTIADFKDAVNNLQTMEANQQETLAKVKAQGIANTRQAAIENGVLPSALSTQEGSSNEPAQQYNSAATQYVDKVTFDNRLKGITYNNPNLYDILNGAFTDAAKKDGNASQMTPEETVTFAEAAKSILADNKVAPEKAQQMVNYLINPAP